LRPRRSAAAGAVSDEEHVAAEAKQASTSRGQPVS
jgi:hypothetical protein